MRSLVNVVVLGTCLMFTVPLAFSVPIPCPVIPADFTTCSWDTDGPEDVLLHLTHGGIAASQNHLPFTLVSPSGFWSASFTIGEIDRLSDSNFCPVFRSCESDRLIVIGSIQHIMPPHPQLGEGAGPSLTFQLNIAKGCALEIPR